MITEEQIELDGVMYNLDNEGNAITEDGTIFKTKDELNPAPTTVNLEGVDYTLDAEGNALDAEGKVFKTKEELNTLLNQPDLPIIAQLPTLSGIELVDAAGKPIEFEDTIEGLVRRETSVYNLGKELGKQEALNEFFKNNPDLQDLAIYKNRYGSVENYFNRVDYKGVVIDENDKEQLRNLIIAEKVAKGESREDAQYIAQMIEADNKLVDKGKFALTYLQNKQIADEKTADDARISAETAEAKEAESFYGVTIKDGKVTPLNIENSIYDIVVNKGQVFGLIIPQTGIKLKQQDGTVKTITREEIFNYLALDNGSGVSQAEYDYYTRMKDPQHRIYTHLSMLLNGDLSQLVKAKINDDKIKTLSDRLKTKTPTTPPKTGGLSRIDLPVQ